MPDCRTQRGQNNVLAVAYVLNVIYFAVLQKWGSHLCLRV
jgi:hypothetical protein